MSEIKEDKNVWGKYKIKRIVLAMMMLTWGTVLLLFITANRFVSADNQQGEITKKILRCHRYVDQMKDGSDVLTSAVWRFAATGDAVYAEDFIAELTNVRSRDHAIENIKAENTTEEELEQIEEAQALFDELKNDELYCMHLLYKAMGAADIPEEVKAVELTDIDQQLTPEEMRQQALSFLFGEEYLQTKEQITTKVAQFGDAYTTRLEGEVNAATNVTEQAKIFMNIALWVLLVWTAGFWLAFSLLIERPMRKCVDELHQEDHGKPLALRGPYELQRLIGAFNYTIARLQEKNQEIYNIKMLDPVTEGFSPSRFDMEVESCLKEKQALAFVVMDVKRFKVVNELYGEETGDLVLRKVYQLICAYLNSGEFASRCRADIFNIILYETSKNKVEERVVQIKDAIKNAFRNEQWNKYRLVMDCGVYMVREDDIDVTSIRGRANAAWKRYKKGEGMLSPCVFYSDKEAERLIHEQRIENQMERALAEKEFKVYLQPKVRLEDGKVIGAEALVRWKTAGGQMISPSEFIPLFEKNGFILQLDYYMFRNVCELLRKWMDMGKEPVPISVNLSREHIKEKGFLKRFQKIQKEYKVPSKLIEFEVTEETVVENLETLKAVVADIVAAGYRCSMDDFGSGYSSLNVLKEIPLDVLKLDRVFFTGKDSERGDNVIKAVLKMAQELNMQTVAEGVETYELVDFLKKEGCDMVQGYVFYHPMPVKEFETKVIDANLNG